VAGAELPIDEDKIVFDYKKRFSDIISSSIFATPAELRSNLALRAEILDYVNSTVIASEAKQSPDTSLRGAAEPRRSNPSGNEHNDAAWNYYISSKFGNRANFDAKLKEGYLNEADVKARFEDNLVLLKYFKNSVEPRIREDLRARGAILDYAEEHNISYESEALKYSFFNTVEEFGGQKAFEKYLADNYLSISDIFYFTKSDFILPIIQEQLYESKLKQDPAYLESIEAEIKDHYNNRKNSDYHIEDKYYLRHIYEAKNPAKLGEQRANMTKQLAALNAASEDALAKTTKLIEPLQASSKLYDKSIKTAIIGKASGYISPIIETKTGLHIFIVDKIVPGYDISYDEARDNIYQLIRQRRIKELELPVLGQI